MNMTPRKVQDQNKGLAYRGLATLVSATERGAGLDVVGLEGSSATAFALARLVDSSRRSVLVVTPTADAAGRLAQDLRFFLAEETAGRVRLFPAPDAALLRTLSPYREVGSERLAALYSLLERDRQSIVVAPAAALLRLVPPRGALVDYTDLIVRGEEIDREALVAKLVAGGYSASGLVEERGDFSERGDILDIFPPLQDKPVRLEFWGDTVESLRSFNRYTQRSEDDLEELVVLPVSEVILEEANIRRARQEMTRLARQTASMRWHRLIDEVEHKSFFPGIEFLLPLFYEAGATVFDYLPPGAVVAAADWGAVEGALHGAAADLAEAQARAAAEGHLTLPEERMALGADQVISLMGRQLLLRFVHLAPEGESVAFSTSDNEELKRSLRQRAREGPGGERQSRNPLLGPLVEGVRAAMEDGTDCTLVCRTGRQAHRVKDLLGGHGLAARLDQGRWTPMPPSGGGLRLAVGQLSAGFHFPAEGLWLITEDEVFATRRLPAARREGPSGLAVASFAELKAGDLVVHLDHGIGRYLGLTKLEVDASHNDYLLLEYDGGDRLYLPVDRLSLVQKYAATEGHEAHLDKLGGKGFERRKRRVGEAVEKIARELVDLYAQRKVRKGHAFSRRDPYFREFEASFPYEETPDQAAAIEEVMADMESDRPMDRLVCGDVGYGKTEVALRAVFKAVMDGKQVAVLVPTTVLCEQHYRTFSQRLSPYPIRVEMLSRFRSPAEQKETARQMSEGKVDVIVGTHRLLQSDVVFRDLGLLIIDEEHRFGVGHKERIKKLKSLVDVLTLSATPIPRTLQISLLALRDLSVIETPPANRLSIRTYVSKFDDHVLRAAMDKELSRGGQVFFVHNRVQSIAAMTAHLRKLVPEAKVGMAHGQMGSRDLEEIMMRFLRREINVLVTSAIIESGLDIPSANTIIINRADRFGLAQIYQLRGRVGRSGEQAYAYLLIPGEGLISGEARRRLKVIMDFCELGSGFKVAMHDLELRGAGNILGQVQSGQINSVGYDMYLHLIEGAVRRLKGEEPQSEVEPELNLRLSAYLPESYVPDIDQRLLLYRRLSACRDAAGVESITEEMRDRYGEPPEEARNLLAVIDLKTVLRSLGVARCEAGDGEYVLSFDPHAPKKPGEEWTRRLMALVSSSRGAWRLSPDMRLHVRRTSPDTLGELRNVLHVIA
ncbi:MAG: transcription-repair coupling factor [Pseudomonadota bacterium]